MNKKELNTNELKKLIGAHRIAQRWHNKNKHGGNFGINIYFGPEFQRGIDKEITGYYDKEGHITSLSFGDLYSAGATIPKENHSDLNELAKWINSRRKQNV